MEQNHVGLTDLWFEIFVLDAQPSIPIFMI